MVHLSMFHAQQVASLPLPLPFCANPPAHPCQPPMPTTIPYHTIPYHIFVPTPHAQVAHPHAQDCPGPPYPKPAPRKEKHPTIERYSPPWCSDHPPTPLPFVSLISRRHSARALFILQFTLSEKFCSTFRGMANCSPQDVRGTLKKQMQGENTPKSF